MRKQLNNYTIYLIKRNHENHMLEESREVTTEIITLKDGHSAQLHIHAPRHFTPKWAKLFKDVIKDETIFGKTGLSSAVIATNINGRQFVVTFGQGRFLLKQNAIEEHFGLRTAVNIVGAKNLKSIDKRRVDAIALQSREQSSREVGANDFGIDVEQDLLRSITGKPQDEKFGEQISGMDALKVRTRTGVLELPELLAAYLNKYLSDDYKEHFDWIDHLSEVKNKELWGNLDTKMISEINNKKFENCWLAAPDIIEWSEVAGFRYNAPKKGELHHDINWFKCIEELGKTETISIDLLKKKSIYCINGNDTIIHKWPIYKCIYCEMDYQDQSFLLSGGRWYRVDADFVRTVNTAFDNIRKFDDMHLPDYSFQGEYEYNTHVQQSLPNTCHLFDRDLIICGGGRSKVEFCDLYFNTKKIIHVKRYGGASSLSHLFAQGRISGALLRSDKDFRKKVNDKLPETFRWTTLEDPKQNEFEIVFAIISEQEGDSITLPFFSRLNLKHAEQTLKSYGFIVSIAKIKSPQSAR